MNQQFEKQLIDVNDLTDREVAALRHIAEVFRSTHSPMIRRRSGRVEGLLTKSGGPLKKHPITRADIYEDAA